MILFPAWKKPVKGLITSTGYKIFSFNYAIEELLSVLFTIGKTKPKIL